MYSLSNSILFWTEKALFLRRILEIVEKNRNNLATRNSISLCRVEFAVEAALQSNISLKYSLNQMTGFVCVSHKWTDSILFSVLFSQNANFCFLERSFTESLTKCSSVSWVVCFRKKFSLGNEKPHTCRLFPQGKFFTVFMKFKGIFRANHKLLPKPF